MIELLLFTLLGMFGLLDACYVNMLCSACACACACAFHALDVPVHMPMLMHVLAML